MFYVYEHWRPDKNVCFYVGKGSKDRAYQLSAYNTHQRNPHHKNIVAKLARMGMKVNVRFVVTNVTEDTAFAIEIQRIAFWRSMGIKLTNLNNGGEGFDGSPLTEEQEKKRRAAIVAANARPEVKEKIRAARNRPEVKEKIRVAMNRPEVKEKCRIAAKATMANPAIREKIRSSNITTHAKPEIMAKTYAAFARPEIKAKMSVAAKARWARGNHTGLAARLARTAALNADV